MNSVLIFWGKIARIDRQPIFSSLSFLFLTKQEFHVFSKHCFMLKQPSLPSGYGLLSRAACAIASVWIFSEPGQIPHSFQKR